MWRGRTLRCGRRIGPSLLEEAAAIRRCWTPWRQPRLPTTPGSRAVATPLQAAPAPADERSMQHRLSRRSERRAATHAGSTTARLSARMEGVEGGRAGQKPGEGKRKGLEIEEASRAKIRAKMLAAVQRNPGLASLAPAEQEAQAAALEAACQASSSSRWASPACGPTCCSRSKRSACLLEDVLACAPALPFQPVCQDPACLPVSLPASPCIKAERLPHSRSPCCCLPCQRSVGCKWCEPFPPRGCSQAGVHIQGWQHLSPAGASHAGRAGRAAADRRWSCGRQPQMTPADVPS